MIAKVISHGKTRREATSKLARALESFEIQGITNNRDFLVNSLRTEEFLNGDTTTDFIERVNPARVRTPLETEIHDATIAAALSAQLSRRAQAKVLTHIQSGWRNSLMPPERTTYEWQDTELNVEYRSRRDGSFVFSINDSNYEVEMLEASNNDLDLRIDSRRMTLSVTINGQVNYVHGPYGDITGHRTTSIRDSRRRGIVWRFNCSYARKSTINCRTNWRFCNERRSSCDYGSHENGNTESSHLWMGKLPNSSYRKVIKSTKTQCLSISKKPKQPRRKYGDY